MEPFVCSSCGAALRAEDLDRRLGVATCSHCGAMFDLRSRASRRPEVDPSAGAAHASSEAAAPRERPEVPMPERFRVGRRGKDLIVTWRWFKPVALFLLLFAVAWDSFLVVWYTLALEDGAPLFAILFPLGHVAVGVGITYIALTMLLNRTTVAVSGGMLTVRHGPLPWRPAPTIRAVDLEQLYVERVTKRSKNGTTVTFTVRAVTRDHKGQKVVTGLERLEQALYLEQQIERSLGIEDQPVAGEVRRVGATA